jgi:hypothetical protein
MPQLDLPALKVMVETAADLTTSARGASERDRDYYDEHQYTSEEIATLRRRKQPIVTINRIRRKVDAMVGLEQRGRVDPRAYPRTPADEQAADVVTKALVFVEDQTRFDVKRSMVFENMIVEGYGGVEIIVEPKRTRDGEMMEVAINRLRWEEIFFDPHSREKDFSDATYIGAQKWMSLDIAMELYADVYQGDGDLEEILQASMTMAGDGETFDDRPQHANYRWGDKRQKRVRVAQMYYRRSGTWYLAIFTGGGLLWNDVSPYQDADGNPCCAIELATTYIDRENARYGVVRGMISQQDEINKRRSKLLHMLNSRQTMGIKGAVDSVASLKRELAAPDGHVEINSESFEDASRVGMRPFDILPQSDQVSGQFALLQESKSEIDNLGPNPALIGQSASSASGRSIMAQQQAGMAELAPIYDSLRDWTNRVYQQMWARIRQFWTDERWIRITDEEQAVQFLSVNRIVGYSEVVDFETGQVQMVPQMENVVAEMNVDIIVDQAPDYVALRQEQFEQLAQLAAQGVPIPPEMIIEASDLRDKAKFLEMMNEQRQQGAAMQAQEAQQAAQMAQVGMQMEQAKVTATVQKDQSQAAKNIADAQMTNIRARQEAIRTNAAASAQQRAMFGF